MSADAGIKNHWGFRSYAAKGDTAHTLAVNTGNGNLVVTATDFVFPARIPSIMMRTYNSADTGVMGMLGRGWRFSFEEFVTEITPSGDVEYTDTTGAVYTWIKSGSSYSRPTGVFSDLTLESGEFVITMPSGFKRVFDASNGLLKRYEDTNGNQHRFNRDQNDLIIKIQANVGTGWADLADLSYSGPRLTGFSCSVDNS